MREAIHALKYERVRSLAVPLGTLLAEAPLIRAMPDAVIVPVPLHSTRFKERGFNQSELLAERLAGCAEMALVSDCLHRTRATAAQTHLNVNERVENVRDAFACRDHRFVGRRAILIDDVCTTGSTLEACAIALKADGATFVAGLTLARAGE